MYGIVNKAMEGMIVGEYGKACWQEICQRAGVEGADFHSKEMYSDDVTDRLLQSGSEILSRPVETLLEEFGNYWITYTGDAGYGYMLDANGPSLKQMLLNLPALHHHIQKVFPHMKAPEFESEELSDGALRVRYTSVRNGLSPMVVGIIRGLGERFHERLQVAHTASSAKGAAYDEFVIRFAEGVH